MAALARHSDQSEDRLATFEKRIAAMLSQQRDEVKRVVDSAGKSAAETVSSMTEERRGDMKDRQKFHQTVLDEVGPRTLPGHVACIMLTRRGADAGEGGALGPVLGGSV